METLDQIRGRLAAQFPAASLTLVPNPSPAAQPSLLIAAADAVAIARFLRDDAALQLDQCSNVTGVDWPGSAPMAIGGSDGTAFGYLEVVYHLFSVARGHGPVVLRLRTGNRSDDITLPSLTPVWRSCEFQEREVFDLFGISFSGHPDLRRILMWDEFVGFPMRRDYTEPDDYEWEPTPHGAVLAKARRQNSPAP